MAFLSRVTGSPVDWSIVFEGGSNVAPPGGTLRGTVRMTPAEATEARGVTASLVATEEFAYEVTERTGTQGSRIDRRWDSAELWRQDLPLLPAGAIPAGVPQELAFMFQLPADALPTLESGVLRVRWLLSVSLDRGGLDASMTQAIVVPRPAAAVIGAGGEAAIERFETVEDGKGFAISVTPRPLIAGAPLQGLVEVPEPFDLKSTRVELKLKASTTSSGGLGIGLDLGGGLRVGSEAKRAVHEERSVWQGALTELEPGATGQRRYGFQGELPSEPIATVSLPHGEVTATIDVIVSRRLRRDEHYRRPVAIASTP